MIPIKRSLRLPLLLALSLVSAACKLASPVDDTTLVSNLRFAPSAFDSFRRNTELKYTLRVPATVSIYIVRRDSAQAEQLVRTLAENLDETKGAHSITWLGETNQRLFAPAGTYIGVLQAAHRRFQTTVQVFHF